MVVCELLKKSPETAQIKDKNGDLPLFLACRRPKVNVNVLRALIQIYPTAAHVKSYGNTALHHLLQTGNASPENVKLLLLSNPDAVRMQNSFGNLPLHYLCASDKPHILTVRTILDAYPKGITSLNKAGETPIQRALAKNNDEAMRERVRIMLRASCSSALSSGQQSLLRQLNWEARRIIIVLCANLAKKSRDSAQQASGSSSETAEASADCKILMDMYYSCDGVWRDIIAFL
jgi:ankyrin repeat protein